ncbi:glycerate kinase [Metabacillus endolithicus]|uniref:Glycerate kinase n=1 Tax=Metabacillus endolithicus TaxID=1535204 RepID=A0ABW5BUX5_9BACI|nr:glycerate kinase [Metabacillus endolithicus]UPG62910.1 glycerate kinase [Metabacillus endolithicus]
MKIIVAPDSFKGSISAYDICLAVKEGIIRVHPNAKVCLLPLADGGEGTVDNLVAASNGQLIRANVRGPLNAEVNAVYGVLGDKKTVVIEMAQASGLPLLKDTEKNPMISTSYGTGELIKHALDAGYRQFIIGLGGSATNDGGVGMLRALGVEFYNSSNEVLKDGGASLIDLAFYDDTHLDPRLFESTITIASDVTNPLCGPNGASAVFGPQKGATPKMVHQLDQALFHFSEVVLSKKNINMRDLVGGGAAGGMGAALLAFCNAKLRSGIDVILEEIQFDTILEHTDLLITGEGKLDSQTLSGKVIKGVAIKAKEKKVPVIGLCGTIQLSRKELDELGILAAFSIVPGPCSLEEAFEHSAQWIADRAESIMKLLTLPIVTIKKS